MSGSNYKIVNFLSAMLSLRTRGSPCCRQSHPTTTATSGSPRVRSSGSTTTPSQSSTTASTPSHTRTSHRINKSDFLIFYKYFINSFASEKICHISMCLRIYFKMFRKRKYAKNSFPRRVKNKKVNVLRVCQKRIHRKFFEKVFFCTLKTPCLKNKLNKNNVILRFLFTMSIGHSEVRQFS